MTVNAGSLGTGTFCGYTTITGTGGSDQTSVEYTFSSTGGGSVCPAFGTSCNDGNPFTVDDTADGICGCSGRLPGGR